VSWTTTICNKKGADNRNSVISIFSSVYCHPCSLPSEHQQKNAHFPRHSFVGISMATNVDDKVSTGHSSDGRLRYEHSGGGWQEASRRAFCCWEAQTRAFQWRVVTGGAFRWRVGTSTNDNIAMSLSTDIATSRSGLFLLCLVVDGNNEMQQKEPRATVPEICVNSY
jgi:hypothetical protein